MGGVVSHRGKDGRAEGTILNCFTDRGTVNRAEDTRQKLSLTEKKMVESKAQYKTVSLTEGRDGRAEGTI